MNITNNMLERGSETINSTYQRNKYVYLAVEQESSETHCIGM